MELTNKQQIQEESYSFPYHYLNIQSEDHELLQVDYLSYLRIVKDLIKPFTGQTILDCGCGDGRFCYEFKNENVKLFGVDYSEAAISFARAFNPEVEFFSQGLETINFSTKADYVVLIETLEHIQPENIPEILNKISNILKDDGKLIITVPSTNLPLQSKHYQHFTIKSLENTLNGNFKIARVFGHSKIGTSLFIFKMLIRMSLVIFPFRKKLPIVHAFLKFVNTFYKKNVELCEVNNGQRIIAVCNKK